MRRFQLVNRRNVQKYGGVLPVGEVGERKKKENTGKGHVSVDQES